MKFLTKTKESEIYKGGLTYTVGKNNSSLRAMLLKEQKNFCAYSEKFIEGLDSEEVEHFNPALKGNDDYFNYYAAVRDCNLHNKKTYSKYKTASFFTSLFFQNREQFDNRIEYVAGQYQEKNDADQESKDLIDFLGFNRERLYKQRESHIARLKGTFATAGYTQAQQVEYFRKHKHELDFITAIEIELGLDLSEFYN